MNEWQIHATASKIYFVVKDGENTKVIEYDRATLTPSIVASVPAGATKIQSATGAIWP